MLRGIRGATTVTANNQEEIFERVAELLTTIMQENRLVTEDIGAVIFSSTPDLNAAFPAAGARRAGWAQIPLFGTSFGRKSNSIQKNSGLNIKYLPKLQRQPKRQFLDL